MQLLETRECHYTVALIFSAPTSSATPFSPPLQPYLSLPLHFSSSATLYPHLCYLCHLCLPHLSHLAPYHLPPRHHVTHHFYPDNSPHKHPATTPSLSNPSLPLSLPLHLRSFHCCSSPPTRLPSPPISTPSLLPASLLLPLRSSPASICFPSAHNSTTTFLVGSNTLLSYPDPASPLPPLPVAMFLL